MHKPLAIALTLALALPVAAADGDAGARARTIAPFLDEQTFAVVRLDLTAVDAAAVLKEFGPFGGIDAAGAKDLQTSADGWLADFKKAGGRDVYLVFSLADTPDFPFLIVPLPDGSDAKALAALFNVHAGLFQGGEKLGDVVFAGSPVARDRLRSLKPAERPELARALAAVGDGAAQMAIIPPPHLVRVFDEMMPVLPKEVGGGSSKTLTRGVKWAALGLDAPPKMALRLTVQSADAAAARALKGALAKALKALGEQKEVGEALPEFDKIVAPLTPQVEEDRLTLALDDKETRRLLEPLVQHAVRVAARNEYSRHLRDLVIGLINDADLHKGRLWAVANLDKAGKPLLSWRVHLLPYLGEEKLYKEFHLDEPWDSDHNKKLIAKMPSAFRGISPKLNEQGKTVYLAPVGKDLAFTGDAVGRRFPHDFADGTANTILLVEADDARAVEWTKPEDLKIDLDHPSAGLGRQSGGFVFAMADASVHFVKPTISKETLRAAFTVNGGDILGRDWD